MITANPGLIEITTKYNDLQSIACVCNYIKYLDRNETETTGFRLNYEVSVLSESGEVVSKASQIFTRSGNPMEWIQACQVSARGDRIVCHITTLEDATPPQRVLLSAAGALAISDLYPTEPRKIPPMQPKRANPMAEITPHVTPESICVRVRGMEQYSHLESLHKAISANCGEIQYDLFVLLPSSCLRQSTLVNALDDCPKEFIQKTVLMGCNVICVMTSFSGEEFGKALPVQLQPEEMQKVSAVRGDALASLFAS